MEEQYTTAYDRAMQKTQDYTPERFVEECRSFIGKESEELWAAQNSPWQGICGRLNELLDRWAILRFATSIGDDNPLWIDPNYAAHTRYGSIIAPPTAIISCMVPTVHGPMFLNTAWAHFVRPFFAGVEYEWYDVMPIGTEIGETSLKTKDVYLKDGKQAGKMVFLISSGSIKNQKGELLTRLTGTEIMVPKGSGKEKEEPLIHERQCYNYSKEEVKKIATDIDGEERRGAKTRFWEDVAEGDELVPVVKGPLHMAEITWWHIGGFGSFRSFELGYKDEKVNPGTRTNPLTNWPFVNEAWDHEDPALARFRGLTLPFDYGNMRPAVAGHLLTNWMGDDGFLRRQKVELRRPFYYGDTIWFRGQIKRKYKDAASGKEYGAVDIEINGINQLGENVTTGNATVYLPSGGKPVELPIPSG